MNELKHAAIIPFVALCGANEPGQKTTQIEENVNCPACLQQKLLSVRSSHDVVSGEEHVRVKSQLARVEAVLADLLNERRGTNALQVEMLSWLRNAETLHTFLQDAERRYFNYDEGEAVCCLCDEPRGNHAFEPMCPLMTLWQKLDPERFQKKMDEMFEQWCNREMNRQALERRQAGKVSLFASRFVPQGTAFLMSEQFRANFPEVAAYVAPRCSCAGGSPRAEPDDRPHEPQCELSTLTPEQRAEYIGERNRVAAVRRYRERRGLDGTETPLFTPQILTSPNDTPRPQGLAAWLPERGILDKDGNDPNAQLFQRSVQIIGIDTGASEDTAAVVVGHTTEDGKLVIDSETIVK